MKKSDDQLMREYLGDTGQEADFAPIGVLRILDGLEPSPVVQQARLNAFEEVLRVIEDMEKASADSGRTVSKSEIKKWLEYELGMSKR